MIDLNTNYSEEEVVKKNGCEVCNRLVEKQELLVKDIWHISMCYMKRKHPK